MNVFQDISLKSIDLYQVYLSPIKGYSCAYRVLHGDESCSSFCKQEIANYGVFTGIANTLNRFRQCKLASIELQKMKKKKSKMDASDKGCQNMDSCEKIHFVELGADAACCFFSSLS